MSNKAPTEAIYAEMRRKKKKAEKLKVRQRQAYQKKKTQKLKEMAWWIPR